MQKIMDIVHLSVLLLDQKRISARVSKSRILFHSFVSFFCAVSPPPLIVIAVFDFLPANHLIRLITLIPTIRSVPFGGGEQWTEWIL